MNARQLYRLFSDPSRPWSPWTKPILFAELDNRTLAPETIPPWNGPSITADAAWILDLPGITAFSAAMVGLRAGLCPVPVYNGASGPSPVIHVLPLASALIDLGYAFEQAAIGRTAPPMFMLDARRMPNRRKASPGSFDNRWIVFPQDFPSFRLLREQGITRVHVLTESGNVNYDLAHILRRWEDGGLGIFKVPMTGGAMRPLHVRTPSLFRQFFRRAWDMVSLRRNAGGGFGGVVPVPSESGWSMHGSGGGGFG